MCIKWRYVSNIAKLQTVDTKSVAVVIIAMWALNLKSNAMNPKMTVMNVL